MHNVGKLAIPDAILNKPSSLTEEENSVMRTHAQAGYEMLKNSSRPIMRVAAIIALEHHERFDGTGYPFNKKGGEISIYGRIVAIADVFNTLGCKRVYKKAWDQAEIMEYFSRERGRYFDPDLADIFIRNIDEIMKIRNRFPD